MEYFNNFFFNKITFRWFFSTNHKEIGILYFIFGLFSGIVGTIFSFLIRFELSWVGSQILLGEYQYYNGEMYKCFFWLIFACLLTMLKSIFLLVPDSLFNYLCFFDKIYNIFFAILFSQFSVLEILFGFFLFCANISKIRFHKNNFKNIFFLTSFKKFTHVKRMCILKYKLEALEKRVIYLELENQKLKDALKSFKSVIESTLDESNLELNPKPKKNSGESVMEKGSKEDLVRSITDTLSIRKRIQEMRRMCFVNKHTAPSYIQRSTYKRHWETFKALDKKLEGFIRDLRIILKGGANNKGEFFFTL